MVLTNSMVCPIHRPALLISSAATTAPRHTWSPGKNPICDDSHLYLRCQCRFCRYEDTNQENVANRTETANRGFLTALLLSLDGLKTGTPYNKPELGPPLRWKRIERLESSETQIYLFDGFVREQFLDLPSDDPPSGQDIVRLASANANPHVLPDQQHGNPPAKMSLIF
jgi:hypothetical protein